MLVLFDATADCHVVELLAMGIVTQLVIQRLSKDDRLGIDSGCRHYDRRPNEGFAGDFIAAQLASQQIQVASGRAVVELAAYAPPRQIPQLPLGNCDFGEVAQAPEAPTPSTPFGIRGLHKRDSNPSKTSA